LVERQRLGAESERGILVETVARSEAGVLEYGRHRKNPSSATGRLSAASNLQRFAATGRKCAPAQAP
jgi:hypothetical protein